MINKKLKKYLLTFLTGIITSTLCLAPSIISANEIGSTKVLSQKATLKTIDTGKATIDGVSVRSTNSASGKYLGSLYTGDKVEIVEKTSNGWYKIKYKNSYAYISKTVINLSGTKVIDNVLNTGTVYNATKLTVRKSNSTSSKFLGYLPKGTKVEIVRATSTNWYKIKYKNSYVYVKGNYIKLTKSKKVTSRENINNSNSSDRKNLNDFLFIGDSFTARMENTIKSKNNMVYVHAQGGSRPSYWLDKVDEMPDKDSIDSISLLIGVNGVTNSKNITDTKALINQLIVKYPDKKIYVQQIFPVGENFTDGNPITHNKAIAEYNKELIKFCSTKSNIKIIDARKDFVNNKGYLNRTSDGLHIDKSDENKFYNNIFNAIKSAEKL